MTTTQQQIHYSYTNRKESSVNKYLSAVHIVHYASALVSSEKNYKDCSS